VDVPGDDLVERWDRCISSAPIQRVGTAEETDLVRVIKFTPDTKALKQNIAHRIFRNNTMGVVEAAPLTAPVVYMFLRRANERFQYRGELQTGIIAGMLCADVIDSGWDASFIGCKEPLSDSDYETLHTLFLDNWNIDLNKWYPPHLCVCIGKGVSNQRIRGTLTLYDGSEVNYITSINEDNRPSVLVEQD